ncbi:hypothetical protein NEHOM01_1930 [Nematocida homosporus]|uniref:uncharacterized protein n=1 Tax=Nematocida homosporus TaxID=1912981 RepID=UPI00221FAEE3|nr:uncharacterized protein NEHOM01_1930 [Nematocida homosporus]KAI5187099.1 hypothetical protein NEHOM01_1930 [Nematocida homosporus]
MPMLFNDVIEYNANPNCLHSYYGIANATSNDAKTLTMYLEFWESALKVGLANDSDLTQLFAMLDNCQPIDNPGVKACSSDIEKDSLSYALVNVIKELEYRHRVIHDYIAKLEGVTEGVPGVTLASLLRTSNEEDIEDKIIIVTDGFLLDYYNIAIVYNPLRLWVQIPSNIKAMVESWKTIVDNTTLPSSTFCAQQQLRHFLYSMLKLRLLGANLLNVPNTTVGAYANIAVDSQTQDIVNSTSKLDIVDMIKTMPTDEVIAKIAKKGDNIFAVETSYTWLLKRAELWDRLSEARRFCDPSLPEAYMDVPVERIKLWASDLRILLEHFQTLAEKTKQLQTKLKPYLTNNKTATSIHECIEYASATPLPTSTLRP